MGKLRLKTAMLKPCMSCQNSLMFQWKICFIKTMIFVMISSLLVILPRADSFMSLSGCFVRVKNRIKSGFFALEALSYLHFRKVGSNWHFCRFWGENRGDRGEKAEEGNTKNYISQNRALNRQNLCSRCIK